MRTVTSVASMTVYTKLPGIVTKYTGKEGWWVGNNLKFDRAGWGAMVQRVQEVLQKQ